MKYSGYQELEIMRLAQRYNAYLVREVAALAPPDRPMLDFGAGLGTFARELAAKGLEVHCLEPDETMARELAAAGQHVMRDLNAVERNSYSYIYSLNVLEHIEDDEAVLQDLCERLTENGKLLLYVPAFPLLYSRMDAHVGHYRRYGMRPMRKLLERAGFEIEKMRFADSLGFFAALFYKWFSRSNGEISAKALVAYDRLVFPVSRLIDRLGAQYLWGKNIIVLARRKG